MYDLQIHLFCLAMRAANWYHGFSFHPQAHMKKTHFFTFLAIASACGMTWAQNSPAPAPPSPDQQEENYEAPVYPTTGVRFVVCSPHERKLPSPLYALYKDEYMPVHITSRGPSERVLPGSDGHILLYENDPGEGKKPEALLDIPLPQEVRKGRVICLVVLGAEKTKPQYFFIRESDLPVGGFYVLNFSPVAIEMVTTTKPGKYPEKGDMISSFKRPEGNCILPSSPNVWTFIKKNNPDVKILEYVLRVPPELEGGTPMMLRSSKFPMNPGIAHLIIIARHPTKAQAFRLISFSYNNEADKRNAANADKAATKTSRGGHSGSNAR